MSRHIIESDKDGRIRTDVPGGINSQQDLDEVMADAVRKGRIVVYFHGGLVNREHGMDGAGKMREHFEDSAYPLSFVWHSGPWEIISKNIGEILGEDIFQRILRIVTDWVVGKARDDEGGRGNDNRPSDAELTSEFGSAETVAPEVAPEPFGNERFRGTTELSETERELFLAQFQAYPGMQGDLAGALKAANLDMAFEGGGRGEPDAPPKPSKMDESVLREIAAGEGAGGRGGTSLWVLATKGLEIVRAVLGRYRNGTDSGIYPTVVDEILRALYLADVVGAVWNAMKKETSDTFDDDGLRAGRMFLDSLAAHLPAGHDVEITLVGHSTGAVFIDNLLRDVIRRAEVNDKPLPEGTQFQVALLAPAATTVHFLEAMAGTDRLVRRLRMFTMKDEKERADRVLQFFYPRSLLYLVSGMLERDGDLSAVSPLIGLSRYLGDDAEKVLKSPLAKTARLTDIRSYMGMVDRVVLSPSEKGAPRGMRAQAIHHGDFDDDDDVLDSVLWMIENW